MQEEAIRAFAPTLAYRMNLAHARSADPALVRLERERFQRALQPLLAHDGPKLVVTDSQARARGCGGGREGGEGGLAWAAAQGANAVAAGRAAPA